MINVRRKQHGTGFKMHHSRRITRCDLVSSYPENRDHVFVVQLILSIHRQENIHKIGVGGVVILTFETVLLDDVLHEISHAWGLA